MKKEVRTLLSAAIMLLGICLLGGFLVAGEAINVFLAAVTLVGGIGLFCSGLMLLFLGPEKIEQSSAPRAT